MSQTKSMDSMEFRRWSFRYVLWAQKVRQLINQDMTVVQQQIVMLIAHEPGISSKEIIQTLDIHPAALSRNIKTLSVWYQTDKKTGKEIERGYDLIKSEVDPRERRALQYYLTKHGKEVVETLWRYLQKLAMEAREDKSVSPIDKEETV